MCQELSNSDRSLTSRPSDAGRRVLLLSPRLHARQQCDEVAVERDAVSDSDNPSVMNVSSTSSSSSSAAAAAGHSPLTLVPVYCDTQASSSTDDTASAIITKLVDLAMCHVVCRMLTTAADDNGVVTKDVTKYALPLRPICTETPSMYSVGAIQPVLQCMRCLSASWAGGVG